MPGGFGSIYGGFKIRELIAEEESNRSLAKLEKLVSPEVPVEQPQAAAESVEEDVEFVQRSAKRMRAPRPPPAPPPVAAVPWSKPEPTMASASSSSSSSAGGSLSESDIQILSNAGVDDQAKSAISVLASVDRSAAASLIFKLIMKRGDELRNPSAFVMQSCLNAMRAHNLA